MQKSIKLFIPNIFVINKIGFLLSCLSLNLLTLNKYIIYKDVRIYLCICVFTTYLLYTYILSILMNFKNLINNVSRSVEFTTNSENNTIINYVSHRVKQISIYFCILEYYCNKCFFYLNQFKPVGS